VTNTIYIEGERRFLILAEKTQMWNFIGSDTKAVSSLDFRSLPLDSRDDLIASSTPFFLRPLPMGSSAHMLAEPLYCVHAKRLRKGEQVASRPLRRVSSSRRRYPSSCLFFLRPLLLGSSAYMLAELLYCVHARRLRKGEQVASQLIRRSSLLYHPLYCLCHFIKIFYSSCSSFSGTSHDPL